MVYPGMLLQLSQQKSQVRPVMLKYTSFLLGHLVTQLQIPAAQNGTFSIHFSSKISHSAPQVFGEQRFRLQQIAPS
jgi:hypothetical protein